jgi:hypothetical protein
MAFTAPLGYELKTQPSHRILRKSWNIAFRPATRQG